MMVGQTDGMMVDPNQMMEGAADEIQEDLDEEEEDMDEGEGQGQDEEMDDEEEMDQQQLLAH